MCLTLHSEMIALSPIEEGTREVKEGTAGRPTPLQQVIDKNRRILITRNPTKYGFRYETLVSHVQLK